MTTPTLTLTNNCSVTQTLTVFGSDGPMAVVLIPDQTEVLSLPGADAALIFAPSGQLLIVNLANEPAGTVLLQPSGTMCVLGTGPAPLTITNNCDVTAIVFIDEFDATFTIFRSITSYVLAPGQSVTAYVRADSGVDVIASPGGSINVSPGRSSFDQFLTLMTVDGVCTLIRTPGVVATTIVNSCPRDAVVTINEVDTAGHVVFTTTETVPARGTVTYIPQSIGTAIVQVCVAGRCVSSSLSTGPHLVTLTDNAGFCAPQLGTPVVCTRTC